MNKLVIKSSTLVEWALYLYLAYIMLPFVSAWLPSLVRTGVILLLVGAMLVGTTLLYPKQTIQMVLLHGLCTLLILMYFFGKSAHNNAEFLSYFTNTYMFLGALAFACVVQHWEEERRHRLWRFLWIAMFVTMITTVIGNLLIPESSRVLADISRSGSEEYMKMNIGGYGFIYGLVVMIPYFVYKVKAHKGYIAIIVLVFGVLLVAQYSIAVFIVAATLLWIWIAADRKPLKIVSMAALILVAYLTISPLMTVILESLQKQFAAMGLDMFADRFEAVIMLFEHMQSSSALIRYNLYLSSWNAFLNNPLGGNLLASKTMPLGGHSEILDMLGIGGILALLVCCAIFAPHISGLRREKNKRLSFYKWTSFLAFLLIAFFNPVFVSGAIAIPLFLVPVLITEKEEDTETAEPEAVLQEDVI